MTISWVRNFWVSRSLDDLTPVRKALMEAVGQIRRGRSSARGHRRHPENENLDVSVAKIFFHGSEKLKENIGQQVGRTFSVTSANEIGTPAKKVRRSVHIFKLTKNFAVWREYTTRGRCGKNSIDSKTPYTPHFWKSVTKSWAMYRNWGQLRS